MAYRVGDGAVVDRDVEMGWTASAAVPSIIPSLPYERRQSRRRWPAHPSPLHSPKLPRCPEIDCVRHLLPPGILALAELRAAEARVGADRVLMAWGVISDETYGAALATSLGIAFEPLRDRLRHECPLPDDRLVEAATTGMLPLGDGDDLIIVVAPCLVDSRRLVALLKSGVHVARRIRVTSSARLRDFVIRHGARDVEHRAIDDLRVNHPEFSAGAGRSRVTALAIAGAAAGLAVAAAPGVGLIALELALGTVFLAWTGLRLLGLMSEPLIRRRPQTFADDWLPTYSVVIALYREAATVEALVAALRRFDYPMEKLDIKLVVEADDHETRESIARLRLGPPFEIVVAPQAGPRTKPKALNAALPFARGSFVAVYDAEDRPEPDQLRLALDAFVAGDERLACVQARLTVDNSADTWLTGLFTAEYAGLFDVFLPGLAIWGLPLPLGGSSNHFRTPVLRRIGAWDPFNVTEDADLGMRLARFGHRTAVIASSTYEEAPARVGPWLRQRTRWFKGWIHPVKKF